MTQAASTSPVPESLDRTGELIERVVAAYGGAKLWRSSPAIETVASVWGPLPLWKFRHNIWRRRIVVAVDRPYSRVAGLDPRRPDLIGVLDGGDVRLEDARGKVIARRDGAREYFSSLKRVLRWDLLDKVYFTGYAAWNYLALPALLLREDIKWKKTQPAVLEANFPEHLPTHSNPQRFHFDPETFLLKQYDYTADIVGDFAKAAHVVHAHENRGGTVWPYDRVVYLRGNDGRPRPLVPPVISVRFENCCFLPALPGSG